LAWRYFIRSAKREKYKYNIRNKREKKPLWWKECVQSYVMPVKEEEEDFSTPFSEQLFNNEKSRCCIFLKRRMAHLCTIYGSLCTHVIWLWIPLDQKFSSAIMEREKTRLASFHQISRKIFSFIS
jgi:hypothetical protein